MLYNYDIIKFADSDSYETPDTMKHLLITEKEKRERTRRKEEKKRKKRRETKEFNLS